MSVEDQSGNRALWTHNLHTPTLGAWMDVSLRCLHFLFQVKFRNGNQTDGFMVGDLDVPTCETSYKTKVSL